MVAGEPWRDRLRRGRDVAIYCASEVGAFAVGAGLLMALSAVAVALLALVVLGFTVRCVHEEAAHLWRTLRERGRSDTE